MNEFSWGLAFVLLLGAIFNVAIGTLAATGVALVPLILFPWLALLFLASAIGCSIAMIFRPQRRWSLLVACLYSIAMLFYNGFMALQANAVV